MKVFLDCLKPYIGRAPKECKRNVTLSSVVEMQVVFKNMPLVEHRETNLISLALLFHYLMLNMFRILINQSSGACDLFVELFHGLYCSGSMCVGVTLWFGCGGVVSVCRLKH